LINEFGPVRGKEPLTQYHKDLAASVQKHCENVIFHMLNHLQKRTGLKNICIAGGVAQNSVANGKVLQMTGFEKIYIPSAGYDAGTAMGAALWLYHNKLGYKNRALVKNSYFGPEYSDEKIESLLKSKGMEYIRFKTENETVEKTAELLANGMVSELLK
jgi:carbamoyltransferase